MKKNYFCNGNTPYKEYGQCTRIFRSGRFHVKECVDYAEENLLVESDNIHFLDYMIHNKMTVDVIYIDPPYNRGVNNLLYKDKYEKTGNSGSEWIDFMRQRLERARLVLSPDGVIVVHIDENEVANLELLLTSIFGPENNLGTIVWNKKNPKGDSRGISVMHEYILCFALDKKRFLNIPGACTKKKENADKILSKAQSLFERIGTKEIPAEILEMKRIYGWKDEQTETLEVEYTLQTVNAEFKRWMAKQPFSNGEKAYNKIDNNGNVFRCVSMAWPNKKTPSEEYFIPLTHPTTGLECPVPARGWRNSPGTMKKLLENNEIVFGEDEKKQPERKYFLKDHITENLASIYENASCDDDWFSKHGIKFEYAKPVKVVEDILISINPHFKSVLDFFAGSGSTGHAVLSINKKNKNNKRFILVTDDQSNICRTVTIPRLVAAMHENDDDNGFIFVEPCESKFAPLAPR